MSNTTRVFYANLCAQVDRITTTANGLITKLDAAQRALTNLINSGELKGEAADAMAAYIENVHLPAIKDLESGLKTLIHDGKDYVSKYRSVDSDPNFQLDRAEMTELMNLVAPKEAKTQDIQKEMNAIMASVSDIFCPDTAFQLDIDLGNILTKLPDIKKLIEDQLEA